MSPILAARLAERVARKPPASPDLPRPDRAVAAGRRSKRCGRGARPGGRRPPADATRRIVAGFGRRPWSILAWLLRQSPEEERLVRVQRGGAGWGGLKPDHGGL